jgi:hypothetical protein
MTAPRAFTTLLTEAIKKMAPQPARANQWLERLSVPRGYSKQEMDTFLAPHLRERIADGNPTLSPDDLVRILEERGAVSRFKPETSQDYAGSQRIDRGPDAKYRVQVGRVALSEPSGRYPGPHDFGLGQHSVLPSWAKMEDVLTERGVREPMAHQIQSDQAVQNSTLRPVAKQLGAMNGRSIAENIPETLDIIRRESEVGGKAYERALNVYYKRLERLKRAMQDGPKQADREGGIVPAVERARGLFERAKQRQDEVWTDPRSRVDINQRARRAGFEKGFGETSDAVEHYVPSAWDAARRPRVRPRPTTPPRIRSLRRSGGGQEWPKPSRRGKMRGA